MSYTKRPYWRWGIFPNLRKRYEVNRDRQLQIFHKGDVQTVQLEGMATSVIRGDGFRGFVRRVLDIGDLSVKGSPGDFLLPNVRGATEFKSALDGKHPSVIQPQPAPPPGPPWHEGIELDDFVVLIPNLPNGVLYAITKTILRRTASLDPYGEIGTFVRKSEALGPLRKSPLDCQIVGTGRDFHYWVVTEKTDRRASGIQNSLSNSVWVALRPRVGDRPDYAAYRDGMNEWLRDFLEAGTAKGWSLRSSDLRMKFLELYRDDTEKGEEQRERIKREVDFFLSMNFKRMTLSQFSALYPRGHINDHGTNPNDILWDNLEDL